MTHPYRTSAEIYRYDPKEGKLQVWIDGAIQEELLIREGMREEATVLAIVAELEAEGYKVHRPGETCG